LSQRRARRWRCRPDRKQATGRAFAIAVSSAGGTGWWPICQPVRAGGSRFSSFGLTRHTVRLAGSCKNYPCAPTYQMRMNPTRLRTSSRLRPLTTPTGVPLRAIAFGSLRLLGRRAWAARLLENSTPGSEPTRQAVHSILLQHPFAPGTLDTEFPPKGQIRARGNHDAPSLLSVSRADDGSSKRRTGGAESAVTMLINKTTA
jgi:hypothetical protein